MLQGNKFDDLQIGDIYARQHDNIAQFPSRKFLPRAARASTFTG